jgi:hypothetical protein
MKIRAKNCCFMGVEVVGDIGNGLFQIRFEIVTLYGARGRILGSDIVWSSSETR